MVSILIIIIPFILYRRVTVLTYEYSSDETPRGNIVRYWKDFKKKTEFYRVPDSRVALKLSGKSDVNQLTGHWLLSSVFSVHKPLRSEDVKDAAVVCQRMSLTLTIDTCCHKFDHAEV